MPRPGVLKRMAQAVLVPLEHLRDGESIQIIELVTEDDTRFASISLTEHEFAQIEMASRLSGIPVEDVVKNIIFTGMKMIEPPKEK